MLGDRAGAVRPGRITIDELFRRAAQRRPDALALADRAEPRERSPTARRGG